MSQHYPESDGLHRRHRDGLEPTGEPVSLDQHPASEAPTPPLRAFAPRLPAEKRDRTKRTKAQIEQTKP